MDQLPLAPTRAAAGTMSAVDELDEVPATRENWWRDARQLFREKHGRDPGIPRDDAQFIIVAYGSLGGVPPTPTPMAAAPRPASVAAPAEAAPAPAAAPGTPERDECPICFEPEKSTALVPCGHILCGACAAKYANCPVCREAVASRMRVFW